MAPLYDPATLQVMVVDDQAVQRALMHRLLANLGVADVTILGSGRDAVQTLERSRRRPDVLISDIDMPEMDGIEFIRTVAEHRLADAVVVSSALEPEILRSVEAMGQAYGLLVLGALPKPVTEDALDDMLDRFATQAVGRPLPTATGRRVSTEQVEAALVGGDIVAHFQPQVEIATGELVGAEALARWPLAGGRTVGPGEFVPMIEEAGLASLLATEMLGQACAALVTWGDAELRPQVSVNLSVGSLDDVETADRLIAVVEGGGQDPRRITFEVTEGAVISDLGRALDVLSRLRVMGFRLAIDDFGTGYASMERLQSLPFSELKIDTQFVRGSAEDESRRALLESSLELARRLGLSVVAEGVETQVEWDLLAGLGCDIAQGWYLARAMPADDLLGWSAGRGDRTAT